MSKITDDLKKVFDLAGLQREAAKKLKPEEWAAYREINEGFDAKVRFENRQYELGYQKRVASVRKKLIDKAGSKPRDFVHKWFGRDGFSRDAIDRQAQVTVRNAHQSKIDGLNDQRFEELNRFVEGTERRKAQRDKPRRDFQRATDRRVGPDRRGPTR